MPRTVRSLFSTAILPFLPTCCLLFLLAGILAGCEESAPVQEKPAEKPVTSKVVAEKKAPPAEPAKPTEPAKPVEQAIPAKPQEGEQAKPASSEVIAEKKAPAAAPPKPAQNSQAARPSTRDFAFLGVFTEAIDKEKTDSGLQIIYVYPGSAGDDMGLKEGDQIIALNDFLIPNRERFVAELRKENIGATIRFLISRDDKKLKLKGKIKSYKKTMGMIQDRLRKKYV